MLYDPSLDCDEQSALSEIAQQASRQEQLRKLEQACRRDNQSLTTAADIARRLARLEAEKPALEPHPNSSASAHASPSDPADTACNWLSRSKASLSNFAGKLGLGPSATTAAAAAAALLVVSESSGSSSSAARRWAPAKVLSGMTQPVARRPPPPPQQLTPAAGPIMPPLLPPLLMQKLPPLLMLSMLRRNSQLSYWEMPAEGDGEADCGLGHEEEEEEPSHALQQRQQSKGVRGAPPCQVSTAHAQQHPSRSASSSPSPQNQSSLAPSRPMITAPTDPHNPGSAASQSDPLSLQMPTGIVTLPLLLPASSTAATDSGDLLILSSSPASAGSGSGSGSGTIPLLPSIFSGGRRSTTPSAAAAGGSMNPTARRSLPSPEQQQQQRGEGRVTPSWRELIVAGRTSHNSATPELLLCDDTEPLGRAAKGSGAHRLHRSATAL